MKRLPCKVRITSQRKSIDDSVDKSKMATDGELSYEDGKYFLVYDEILSDSDTVHTTLSFDETENGVISLKRNGAVDMSCVFCEGERFRFSYDVGFAETELTVFGKHIKNTIGENGGSIFIEYSLEANGALMTECKMSIRAII